MNSQRATRYLGLFSVIVILLVLSAAAQQTANSFSDDFHKTTLDSTHWKSVKNNAIGTTTPTAQGLEVSLKFGNQGFYAEHIWLTCQVHGDFDAQVSYTLVDWPTESGVRLGLGVLPNARPLGSTTLVGVNGSGSGLRNAITERVTLAPGEIVAEPGGGDFYAAAFNGNLTQLITTRRLSGKLRLQRAGTTFTASYYDPDLKIFSPLGVWSVLNAEDEWLALALWGRYSLIDTTTVRLENFSITASALGCS
jgi:hypothetical protein